MTRDEYDREALRLAQEYAEKKLALQQQYLDQRQ